MLLTKDLLTPTNKDWTKQLDDKVRRYFLSDTNTLQQYQENTELYVNYSHDVYPDIEKPGRKTPVERFLGIHLAYVTETEKNQDLLLVGSITAKKEALLGIVRDVRIEGFVKMMFVNMDTGEEEVFFDLEKLGKVYRALYTQNMTHPSMQACIALSGKLFCGSGDQLTIEGGVRFLVYEERYHKTDFIKEYRKQLSLKSSDPDYI